MPKYILDTDTCIYWLKGDRRIEKKILTAGLENVTITVITECELFYGAYKSARVDKNLEVLKALRKKNQDHPNLYRCGFSVWKDQGGP